MPLLHSTVMKVMPHVPKPILWRVAKRYVAGESLESAIARLKSLQQRGFCGGLGAHPAGKVSGALIGCMPAA